MTQDRIDSEAAALWRAVFNEPPIIHGHGSLMLELILKSLPPVGYGPALPAADKPPATVWR